jgi:UDP-N-acetylmuramate dehydrogenase
VIKIETKGVEISRNFKSILGIEYDLITASSGEVWDDFVYFTIQNGYYGLENLSYIPGSVGASPVQNIGAYGVEAGDFVYSVKVLNTETGSVEDLSNTECRFGYRDSIFKAKRGKYIVLTVSFLLAKQGQVDIAYKDIQEYIKRDNLIEKDLKPEDVRNIVIDIRKNKLPDWTKWGTAGSFFKNPIIKKLAFDELKKKYPQLPGFDIGNDLVKVSLAYILDKICQAKNFKISGAKVYDKQALVIIAEPGTKAVDVIDLSKKLISQVKNMTNIDIECEVEWVV